MCQGGQGNFNMRQPGFASGGPDDPAQGGTGYYGGGSASWGGDYGNWANKNVPPGGNFGNWGGNPNASGLVWGTSGPSPYPGWGWSPPVQNPGMPVTPPTSENLINPNTQTTPPANPFAGIDAGRLGQAQRFANAGLFGRAKQQIGLGGGNWDNVGGLLRQQAGETDNYGGDWNWGNASDADVSQAQAFAKAGMYGRAKQVMGDNWTTDMSRQLRGIDKTNPYTKGTSMGFDWGDASAGRLAKAKEFATAGNMGRAKQMYERGGGKWSPTISNQFRAWAKANQ